MQEGATAHLFHLSGGEAKTGITFPMDVEADAAQARRGLDRALGWLEEWPLVVILAAAAATVGTSIVLASCAGRPHVLRVVYRGHSWARLLVCLVSEVVAYGGAATSSPFATWPASTAART
jgi:hypothetical protein